MLGFPEPLDQFLLNLAYSLLCCRKFKFCKLKDHIHLKEIFQVFEQDFKNQSFKQLIDHFVTCVEKSLGNVDLSFFNSRSS